MERKRIVVLTGAGISAESGLRTFRDGDGLWEEHEISSVATPDAWQRDPALVLRFYNERRKAVRLAQPNPAHIALAQLEKSYEVEIITQNIDDLHERAGSSKVLHLHGEILKARSSADERLIYPVEGDEIRQGQLCEKGSQLRPHIVWFGEAVPMMDQAIELVRQADIFLIIGTSLAVYPAAGLLNFVAHSVPKYLVDPKVPEMDFLPNLFPVQKPASAGVPELVASLLG